MKRFCVYVLVILIISLWVFFCNNYYVSNYISTPFFGLFVSLIMLGFLRHVDTLFFKALERAICEGSFKFSPFMIKHNFYLPKKTKTERLLVCVIKFCMFFNVTPRIEDLGCFYEKVIKHLYSKTEHSLATLTSLCQHKDFYIKYLLDITDIMKWSIYVSTSKNTACFGLALLSLRDAFYETYPDSHEANEFYNSNCITFLVSAHLCEGELRHALPWLSYEEVKKDISEKSKRGRLLIKYFEKGDWVLEVKGLKSHFSSGLKSYVFKEGCLPRTFTPFDSTGFTKLPKEEEYIIIYKED